MDQFSQPVLSKKLLTIIANSTTSTNQIIFKRAIASSDKYKLDDLSGFDDTSISTIKKASETVFSNVTIDGNGIQLTAIFSSNGNDSNYDINTILFTAEYGGQEFLAFSQIANYSLTVPAGSSKEVFNLTLKPKIIIDSVKNISTTVNPSGVATNEYVDSHDSELKKMIDEGTSDRKNIWTKFSDYILKSGNPQTIDTKLTFTEKINGTATKSDALATARTINGTNFDGTANISIKASNDSDLVHKSSAETISGDKNYTGKLQKGGIDVATTSDVTNAQSSAINTANSYTDSSINSLEIGGRNLLLNTTTLPWNIGNNADGTISTITSYDSTTNMWHITSPKGSGGNAGIFFVQSGTPIVNGKQWSFSFDIKGTGIYNQFGIEYSSPFNVPSGSVPSEWTRVSSNGVASTGAPVIIYFDTEDVALDVYIKLPKLETGKPTDWTPAPEDKLDVTANAVSATKLQAPRQIGGVAFDGTTDINLPGVNTTGNQNTTGLANAVQSLEITNGTDLSTIKGYGGSAVYHIASGITLTSTPSDYSGKGAILKVTESGTTVYQELIDVVTDNGSWIRIIDGSTVNDWQTKGGGGVKFLSEADIPTPTYASSSTIADKDKYTPTFSNMHLYATNNTLRLTGTLVVLGTYWNALGNKMGYLIDASPLVTSSAPQVPLNGSLWGKGNISYTVTTIPTTEVRQNLSVYGHVDYISFNGEYFYFHIEPTEYYQSGIWSSGHIPIDITVTYS